jgi:hypothetical protein
MRVAGPFDAPAAKGLKAFAALPRAVEKTSGSSGLGRERQDLNSEGKDSPPRLQVELVCQEETRGHDPFWDAPRLLPTFVAQVMGQTMNQLMPERRETVSVETAYASAAPRKALLLDRKS